MQGRSTWNEEDSSEYTEYSYLNVMLEDYGVLVATVPEVSKTPVMQSGDVNGDEAVDILDIILVNRAVLGKVVLSESQIKAGDIDKNGKVAPEDSLIIMKYIIGLLDSLV